MLTTPILVNLMDVVLVLEVGGRIVPYLMDHFRYHLLAKKSRESMKMNTHIYSHKSKLFKPACDRHDICYMSVGTKEDCDSQMYATTNNVCANANYAPPTNSQ
jgi:hypothetical protein